MLSRSQPELWILEFGLCSTLAELYQLRGSVPFAAIGPHAPPAPPAPSRKLLSSSFRLLIANMEIFRKLQQGPKALLPSQRASALQQVMRQQECRSAPQTWQLHTKRPAWRPLRPTCCRIREPKLKQKAGGSSCSSSASCLGLDMGAGPCGSGSRVFIFCLGLLGGHTVGTS